MCALFQEAELPFSLFNRPISNAIFSHMDPPLLSGCPIKWPSFHGSYWSPVTSQPLWQECSHFGLELQVQKAFPKSILDTLTIFVSVTVEWIRRLYAELQDSQEIPATAPMWSPSYCYSSFQEQERPTSKLQSVLGPWVWSGHSFRHGIAISSRWNVHLFWKSQSGHSSHNPLVASKMWFLGQFPSDWLSPGSSGTSISLSFMFHC